MVFQHPRFFCQGQIGMGQLLKICTNASGSGNHYNIPSGRESVLIDPIDLPQTAAHPIADHCVSQFFTHGNAHPIGGSAVRSCIKHKEPIGMTGGGIKPPEDMIQF